MSKRSGTTTFLIAGALLSAPVGALAAECGKAAFDAYCAGATIGLSRGAEKTDPDLSAALKVKSADYVTASKANGHEAVAKKFIKAGIEDSVHSTDAQVMESLLGLCVSGDGRARASFGRRAANDCKQN